MNYVTLCFLLFQTSLNQEIKQDSGVTLHQSTIVRWLSLSDLLESVIKSFKTIRKLLIGKEKQRLMMNLNQQYLKQLCALLKPFNHIVKSIQIGNGSSLFFVPMCYVTLKEVLQSFESIKKYNQENLNEDKENEPSDDSNDDDLEPELPGIYIQRKTFVVNGLIHLLQVLNGLESVY